MQVKQIFIVDGAESLRHQQLCVRPLVRLLAYDAKRSVLAAAATFSAHRAHHRLCESEIAVEIDCVCSQEIHQIHFSASSARKRALAWRHARRMTKMDVFLYKWCARCGSIARNPCARLTLLQPRGAHNNELSANFFAHFHGNNNRFTFPPPPGMCVGASFIYNFFPACRRRTK